MNDDRLTWEEAVQWLREQPGKEELVRQCYFEDPIEDAVQRFWKSEEWRSVRRLLRRHLPGRVLDIGAGRGISSCAFAKEGCLVFALEPDPSPLVGAKALQILAQNTGLPIEVIMGCGEELPFEDGSFDIIYGRAVLHHARSLKRLSHEAVRVLRTGGIFMATREHVISRSEDLDKFLNSHPLHVLYGGEMAYVLQKYKEAIRGAGLKLRKIIGPFESAINYAPMTREDFQAKVASNLAQYVGEGIAGRLASIRRMRRLYGWYLSRRVHTPGRLFSFVGRKN